MKTFYFILLYHQLLDKMPKGIQGMINLNSNINKLAKFSNNPGITHYRCLLHLIGYIKNTPSKGIKFYSKYENFQIFLLLKEHNITSNNKSVITFCNSSWNDCVDTGRSTGGHITFIQGGSIDYGSHLPVPVAMLSGEA